MEDLNAHIGYFLDICGTIKINRAPEYAIKLRLFPFSSRDKVKQWYQSLEVKEETMRKTGITNRS